MGKRPKQKKAAERPPKKGWPPTAKAISVALALIALLLAIFAIAGLIRI